MAVSVTSRSHASSYHVFLSFRGEDTRHGFIGHLYEALDKAGIYTFIDDKRLRSGEDIKPALEKAIQESRIAIVVFSDDYASSSFCLDELATIHDCRSKGLLVIPIFFKVDPSHVRHQRGSYEKALADHESNPDKLDKLPKWKKSLRQVADLSGFHFKDGYQYESHFIKEIVASVIEKINHPARLSVPDHMVGLEPRKAKVMNLLDVGSNDGVHMVGIHGMGGVGKSTLARVVYNDLIAQEKFGGFCYLENVKENSIKELQGILIQKILRNDNIKVTSVEEGKPMISERLQGMKVLLLVDNIDDIEQLNAIVGRPDWFGRGSRIIITTRDKQLLTSHGIKQTYEVEGLNENDARQLLTWKAFNKEKADPPFEEVLNSVVSYASGLPLALEVIGAHLCGKSIEAWESAINQYKRSPHDKILKILEVSFDALTNEIEQSVFLDFVCCFKGYKLAEVEVVLHALYGYSVTYAIEVLVDKSLIKISEFGTVKVHDLIHDVGRQIELEKSPTEPGKRRRLWLLEHIREVLEDNTGTREIEIIYLDVPKSDKEEIIELDGNAFKKMKRLKVLTIKNGKFSKGPECLPNSLKVLEWCGYPSHCLPSGFDPENLVISKLTNGCLTSFEFHGLSKEFKNLKTLILDYNQHLTEIPDLSCFPNLVKLSFKHCPKLVRVHDSVGRLDKLEELGAKDCNRLQSFPDLKLTSLKILELSYCSRLRSFPEILEKMENIKKLDLKSIAIKELPMSFQYLTGLENLFLGGFEIGQVLSRIVMMPQLRMIRASGCKWGQWVEQEENEENVGSKVSSKSTFLHLQECNLNDVFFSMGLTHFDHVKYLTLWGNDFTILPECIKEFQYLKKLDVSNCKHLQEIKGVPPNIEVFCARNCKSLSSLSKSMLTNQELYKAEAGMSKCILPGKCVPKWFDRISTKRHSSSFWFRNHFPPRVLFLLIAPVEDGEGFVDICPPKVIINGKVLGNFYRKFLLTGIEMDYTYVFDFQHWRWRYDYKRGVSLKKWNRVDVTYEGVIETSLIKASGIHVFKQESNKKDIRFTDPHSKKRKFVVPIRRGKFHRNNLCMNSKKEKKKKMN